MTGVTAPRPALLPGLLMATVGAVLFSAKAIIVKLAYRYGVDAVLVIMLRMLFALPLFALMAWWASRGRPPLTRRDWLGVAGLGFSGYYLSSFLDFIGLQYITASLERLILYLGPTLVLLLGWALFRRPVRVGQVAGIALSYAGVVLVFAQELEVQGGNVPLGAALVFGSTISYAVYMVLSGEVVQRLGALRLVGFATSIACLLCILQYVLLRPVAQALAAPPEVLWLSVVNAVLCTAVPVLLLMMAVERIGPALTSQTSVVGPVATILLGVWLLGEPFTALVAAGTVLVIAGIFVFTRASAAR